jgi:septum formation protein
LLGLICPRFEVAPSDFDESEISADIPPAEHVSLSASHKARAVADGLDNAIVIGADTIVVVGSEILGKPIDEDGARRMLHKLSGRTHQVYTGLAVISLDGGKSIEKQGVEQTDVVVRELSEAIIDRYVATKEPMDKAGAYAIQGKGAVLIEKINGCFFNVVGLPVFLLSRILGELGVEAFECR